MDGSRYSKMPYIYRGHNKQDTPNCRAIEVSASVSKLFISITTHVAYTCFWLLLKRAALRVCLCVCERAYLRNYMFNFHQTFKTRYLWLWLASSLAVLRYIMYFRFYGWRHFPTMGSIEERNAAALRRGLASCAG